MHSLSKLNIIGSDNGLSPGRCQAIIWTNAGVLLIGPLGTNFSEISIEIHIFSFRKMPLKMSLGNWQPSCLSLNVLSFWTITWSSVDLTDLPLDKMAAISQTMFSDAFLWMTSFVFWVKFHWSLFLSPVDSNLAMVLIMAWCWIGDKPLSGPMLTWFTDAYMLH